jgi:hypothetical protein
VLKCRPRGAVGCARGGRGPHRSSIGKGSVLIIFNFGGCRNCKLIVRNAKWIILSAVKDKRDKLLAVLFIAVFAVSRIPGLMPANFSAAYAFAFCAGVYFRGATAWWLPLVTMLVTDVALNVFHYHVAPIGFYLLLNYAVYAVLIGLGKYIGRKSPFYRLLLGGLSGAVIFYLVTNSLSWLQDPAYSKTFAGWIQALTIGRLDWQPTTWEMFRNTFLSGGIFTALFAGAAKLSAPAESPADKRSGARDDEKSEGEEAPEEKPEEAKG